LELLGIKSIFDVEVRSLSTSAVFTKFPFDTF